MNITESFSNREIAIIIWIGIIIVYFSFYKDSRRDLWGIVKAFANRKIVTAIAIMIIYIAGFVAVFYKLHLWTFELLKDTVIWFITLVMVLFVRLSTIRKISYFKTVALESIKWTCITEFMINFYTFNLAAELVIVPLVLLLAVAKAHTDVYSERDGGYEKERKTLMRIFEYFGIFFLLYVAFKAIVNYKELFTITNLKLLLLSPVFTILFLPLLYILALYTQYGEIFSGLGVMTNDKAKIRRIKLTIISVARSNLDNVTFIDDNMRKGELYNSTDMKQYFIDLIKRKSVSK